MGEREKSSRSAADVVVYSRLVGVYEYRTLRASVASGATCRSPHRLTSRTCRQAHRDGAIVEFRSVIDAVRCALEIQDAMVERNDGVPADGALNFGSGFIWAISSRRATAI